MLRIGFILALLGGSPAVFDVGQVVGLLDQALGGFEKMQQQISRLNGGKTIDGMPDLGRLRAGLGGKAGNDVVSVVVIGAR